jgi:uncharacterized protein (DUF697 family)
MYESGYEYQQESYEFPAEAGPWETGEAENEGYESETANLEAEFAGQLLEVTTEAELDRFLGDLAKSVMKGASSFIKSPIGKAVGGVLKNVAKTALPVVGGALGSMVLPGAGTAIGSKLGSLAGGLLEAGEAEVMGEAEAQYEAAQRYVRFARATYGNAANAPRNVPPRTVARSASISAARQYAPSLLRNDQRMAPWRGRRRPSYGWPPGPPWVTYAQPWYGADGGFDPDDGGDPWASDQQGEAGGRGARPGGGGAQQGPPQRAMEGRWVRRGNRIVILGA